MTKVNDSLQAQWDKLTQQLKDLKKADDAKFEQTKIEQKESNTPKDKVIKTASQSVKASYPAEVSEPTLQSTIGYEEPPELQTRSWSSSGSSSEGSSYKAMMNTAEPSSTDNDASSKEASSMAGKAMAGKGKAAVAGEKSAKASIDDFNFDASEYAITVAHDDAILNSWDEALQKQQQSKKLLMLLMYLLKQSETGDLNTAYQLCKVVAQIVCMDRGLQNSYLVRQLIKCQQLTRESNMVLAQADPNDSENFMKILQEQKANQETTSMNMKLITTMLEETKDVMSTTWNLAHNLLQADVQLKQELLQGW